METICIMYFKELVWGIVVPGKEIPGASSWLPHEMQFDEINPFVWFYLRIKCDSIAHQWWNSCKYLSVFIGQKRKARASFDCK